MNTPVLLLAATLLTSACALTPMGPQRTTLPAAVQGSNDAQGSPITVPGAGMGVGAGAPAGSMTPTGR